MSPEGFINNVYGPKTDVWAFGVMIYELLHGETPFSSCRTENELKQSLSIPLSKTKIKSELSNEVKDVIMRCMDIEENKRISVQELAQTPYFRRLLGKEHLNLPLQSHPGIHGSAFELRVRSPSYNGESSKFLKSEQIPAKRKVSVEKPMNNPPQSPPILKVNLPAYEKAINNFVPFSHTSKNLLEPPAAEGNQHRDRRAVST
jgi:serine/threonine protein kinase